MPTLSKDHLPGYRSPSGGLLGDVLGTVSPGRLAYCKTLGVLAFFS